MEYKMKGNSSGVFGHEKQPKKLDVLSAQQKTVAKAKNRPMQKKGNPEQAFAYKY